MASSSGAARNLAHEDARSTSDVRRFSSSGKSGFDRKIDRLERISQGAKNQNVAPIKRSFDRVQMQNVGTGLAAANDDQWEQSQERQQRSDRYREEMQRKESLVAARARTVGEQEEGVRRMRAGAATIAVDAGRKASIIRSAAGLAVSHRKRVKEGDFSVFFLAFVLAGAKDGLLDMIPIVGAIPGLFITVYLVIFLWGKGTLKWRILWIFLLALDLIPIVVNLIPFSTFCVWIAYRHARRDAEESQGVLRNMESSVNREVSRPTPILS